MAIAGIPIIRTVRMAYVDVWRAARAMPGLLLVSVVFVFALRQVEFSTVPKSMREFPVAEFAAIILVNLMRMPLSIAIYRFLLAAEVTAAYAIDFRARRFRRFFAWSVALSSVWLMSGIVAYMWSAEDTVGWVGTAVAMLAYGIAAVWLVILFPAIAIDAPGATVSNSIADTKGHVLNVLLIYLVALATISLPIMVWVGLVAALAVLVSALLPGAVTASDPPGWLSAAVLVVVDLVPTSLIAGIDARIFQALADRVSRPSM
jgi:hypothetical protein